MRLLDLTAAEPILTNLRERAEANPVPLEMVQALSKGLEPPKDLNRAQTAEIPVGILVTFSMEVQPKGLCRHLSISVDGEKMPNPVIITAVMEMLGFVGTISKCMAWIEDCRDGNKAVNVLEPHDGDWTPFRK